MSTPHVIIRAYEKGDYDKVCKLFYDGMVENWVPAYRRVITGCAPLPAMCQLVILSLLYIYSSSIFWFLFMEFLVQVVSMLGAFYIYWAYASEHLNSDMGDKELSYWTCRGVDTTGFFVATIDDVVVGTISYIRQSDEHLEINRLSTDKNIRKAGVASKLVAKIESVATELKCVKIIAETSIAQEAALKFYNRNGWIEQSRTSYPGNFIHGIELVQLYKSVNN